jgi:hypothetical protein
MLEWNAMQCKAQSRASFGLQDLVPRRNGASGGEGVEVKVRGGLVAFSPVVLVLVLVLVGVGVGVGDVE